MTECAHPDIREKSLPLGSGWLSREETGPKNERSVEIRSEAVPEFGTWQVTVRCTPGTRAVFGQRRNLIRLGNVPREVSFYTCLTPYIPSMSTQVSLDKMLFASCVGGSVQSMTVSRAKARRVFIAGDSTAADQSAPASYYPFDSYCGWGQMLPLFLRGDAVCNQAHSGMTSRCFMSDGHFDILTEALRKGDLVLIQFGHNDQKRSGLQPSTGYPGTIRKMLDRVREKGGIPVFLSPVSRVPGRDENGPFDLLFGHAAALEKLAGEEKIPFIDLHRFTFDRYVTMGDKCCDCFRPGDRTHANDPGALAIARRVAEEMERLKLAEPVFDELPDWLTMDRERDPLPRVTSLLPAPYLDLDAPGVDREKVIRMVNTGLLDPCVAFMHPFDPLPRGQFVQLLFRALGLKGEATEGKSPCPDVGPYEWDSAYAKACVTMGMLPDGLYRSNDPVSREEASFMCAKAGQEGLFEGTGVPGRYEILLTLLELLETRTKQAGKS